MLTIFIILLICFVVWPLLRAALTVRRMRRQAREAYEQMAREAQRRERTNRPGGWSAPHSDSTPGRQHGKKIDPQEGEYVAFEEISITSQQATSSSTSNREESTTTFSETRVEDAEWEEIKP